MKYKYFVAGLLLSASAFMGSCKDEFADINTNPTVVSKADPRYLFTQALSNFDGHDYFEWFYDFTNMQKWAQTTVSSGGNDNLMTTMTNAGSLGSRVYPVMNIVNELKYLINTDLSGEEQAKYTYLKAICDPLMIYLAMLDSDMYGSMAYTEAYQARYGGTLTPKYDTQEELFELWETQLKEAVETLANEVTLDGKVVSQQSLVNQDLIYKGDYTKWLKFANSLRLKLAARLINEDLDRALNIVKEVSKYPVMDSLEDDFFYNKSIDDRHFAGGNSMNRVAGSMQLINFLVDNLDPRVRFFFEKNDYNSVVVQAFLDKDQTMASFIEDKIEVEVDENGKKVFKGWKAPGEPWVRYIGMPTVVDANSNEKYPEYIDYYQGLDGNLWKVSDLEGNGETTYAPYSCFNQYMFDKKEIIDYPVAPGAPKVQITDYYAWYGLYLSTAEVNLYLAEFKLLAQGKDIGFSNSAESYLKKGTEYSVRAYDKLANLNKIPYYHQTFEQDKFDKSIKLEEAEVTNLLTNPTLVLDGTLVENLEKVYLQQYIHFVFSPADQFVMMRRSGCPMIGSELYPMEELYPGVASYPIPRRFQITEPAIDDKMGDIKKAAYAEQGYSYGPNPSTLNTERVWYDKKAPQFGEGPKL
ncbi:MAG: SusD/RagB family nutrient-binding outer membrane lipoprotein [Bacteroidaceae bacterium]|nr:SusD/RagB family nutrient-binding outer membrane lipoprotein [Bacteroidaceae bacterium]